MCAGEVQIPQLLQSAAAIAMLFAYAGQPGVLDAATAQALQVSCSCSSKILMLFSFLKP